MIFRVKEFKTIPSILQCFKCQGFGHKAPNCTKNEICVMCGESHLDKNCPQDTDAALKMIGSKSNIVIGGLEIF